MSTSVDRSDSPDPVTTDPIAPAKTLRNRVRAASLVGTTIEFYDFYVYATAAVAVFPALFFTGEDETAKLLASMATFGAAFIARPIGSVLFGHFGDRVGRKVTLIGALLTMGIATILIGLLPTYYSIGLWAPIMLTILRFCQGLGLGGEWSGAALLATEYAEEGKRARAAMWPQLGAPFGFILANGFFLILTVIMGFTTLADSGESHAFLVWGWRIPFIASIIMVGVGLYVRFSLEETPVFKKAVERSEPVKSPVTEVFKTSWLQIIQGTFIMLATYVLFYLMTAWILSYGIGSSAVGGLGIPYRNFLVIQLVAVVLFALTIPVSGWLADKYGRRSSLLVVTAGIVVFGLMFGWFIAPENLGTGEDLSMLRLVVFLGVGMALMGLTFGSMSAVLPELFPTNVRYTGSGIAYNMASILGAALTPYAAVWLNASFGVPAVGLYLSGAAVITFVALWLSPETRHVDMVEVGNK
ncbi:MFS transporter [Kocuria sp. ZOR0020]|uniref:MFS transporter n=1 Tax=Kocuria sp. ZOR0020 TaxID=1339234 RepID=UPI000645F7AA|nr:MFS transporter [Kocuria sp. ZOR0020]